eukprot:8803185-Ditylum_brightwellii.AAC.1
MNSHTGATMIPEKGSVYSMSTRQKINTKSSTETKLVGVNDALSMILWTCYFIEAQGYDVDRSIVIQDNKSAMLLETNGKVLSGKRTRHINIRYFLVQDIVEKKGIDVEYCPTVDIVEDYFSKPLQGKKFRDFQTKILNHKKIAMINPSQEYVEEYQFKNKSNNKEKKEPA